MNISDVKERTVLATRKVGDIEVTAVFDGLHKASLDVVLGVEAAECRRLIGAAGDHVHISVNCFLIESGGKIALVDTGGSTTMPGLGRLPENLRAAGIAPEAIDHVLLTHFHRDHSNGLIDEAGRAIFPRAALVVREEEACFYLDRTVTAADPERVQRGAQEARRNAAPYRDRMRRVGDGEVLPGVSAVLLAGHTPGHTGWLVQSRGERLLIWGDIIHIAAIQVPRPDAGLVFDVDLAMARATRERTFAWVAQERLCIAGAHLDFPGFGTLVREGSEYRYAPVINQ
jgi:glyoxylase-like metal-dependent hydrolase (beta-lactamase superfamily II)